MRELYKNGTDRDVLRGKNQNSVFYLIIGAMIGIVASHLVELFNLLI